MARPSIHVLEVEMPLRPFSPKGENGLIQAKLAEGQAGPSDDRNNDEILRAKKVCVTVQGLVSSDAQASVQEWPPGTHHTSLHLIQISKVLFFMPSLKTNKNKIKFANQNPFRSLDPKYLYEII